jgi:hypothetical protein
VEKVIKDGYVAVLYSPYHGAGWSTWNSDIELIFDPSLVNLILEKKYQEASFYVSLKWPDVYQGGIENLTVAWVPEGAEFVITEYDGSETITLKDDFRWFKA